MTMYRINSSQGSYYLGEDNSLYKGEYEEKIRISNFKIHKVGFFRENDEVIRVFKLINSKNIAVYATFTARQLLDKRAWILRLDSFGSEGGYFWFGTMTDLANMKEWLYDLKEIEFSSTIDEWINENKETVCPFFYGKKLFK